jgi:uncharacterized protein (TIGR02271 family)
MVVLMNKEEPVIVVDQMGLRGLVDPAQFTKANQVGVRVRFADRQALVPVELLAAQEDGTFYLPLSLAELVKQTENEANQQGAPVVLPVTEEELHVQKRTIETGVQVTKLVHERQETFELPLISEEIEIRRLPVNRRVDQPVAIRQEGDVIVVPVLEEVLVVQKQLLLKEEVHIITKRTETRQSGQETLRREEVLVEPIQGEAS